MLNGRRTWTVTGEDHLPVGPVEEYLEFLRVAQQDANVFWKISQHEQR